MSRIALTTCTCDNRYVDVLKVFLASMRENNGTDLLIRADLYNGNDEIYSLYKRIYPNLEINHTQIPKEDWEDESKMLKIMYPRVTRIYDTMLEGFDQILHIDCDTIIRKSLDHIWDEVDPGTIKIWDRGQKRQDAGRARFQAGVHLFGNSQSVQEYYEDWMKDMGKNWGFFDGQRQMYFTWFKHKDTVKLVPLDPKYNDLHFGKDSYIWHARHTHLEEEPFNSEFRQYFLKAREYAETEH